MINPRPSHPLVPMNWQKAKFDTHPTITNWKKNDIFYTIKLDKSHDLIELDFCTHVDLAKVFQTQPFLWVVVAPSEPHIGYA